MIAVYPVTKVAGLYHPSFVVWGPACGFLYFLEKLIQQVLGEVGTRHLNGVLVMNSAVVEVMFAA